MVKQYDFDLCQILIMLAKAYEGTFGISVEEYLNSFLSETQNEMPQIMRKPELAEILKMLIEFPQAAENLQYNILANDLLIRAMDAPENMRELRKLLELINNRKFKIPDRLKN